MAKAESIEEFYRHKFNWMPESLKKDIGHFNVFRMEDCIGHGKEPIQYTRREYYKITLLRGKHAYHYGDKSLEVSGTTLLFFNPDVPYKFEQLSGKATGYFCIFKEPFFSDHLRASIKELPMYSPGAKPGYVLTKQQDKYISNVFDKMLDEISSDYAFKYDLLRNYITEMIHYALKLQPTETLYQGVDANTRITTVFAELLERQFPIESTTQRFTLRSAKDFAEKLSVHVNHLNRAIRLTTGKTTTNLITERVTNEAMALLKHTKWNVSEISFCLGFEDPAHFNHFFKKHTDVSPSSFRK